MKVLVTGAGGYIGSQLVKLLTEKGHSVICLDRYFFGQDSLMGLNVRIVRDDIRTCAPDYFRGVEAVLDLASLSNDPSGELDPIKTLAINYEGRARVARLAKRYGVSRYVLASTCSVYGSSPQKRTERSDLNPLTTYAKANALAEREVLKMTSDRFCTTVLRQATVYGFSRRMRFDLAINGMVLAYHKRGKISIMRDGTQWRPFVHIRDASKVFAQVLESDGEIVSGEIFNVGSNEQNFQIIVLAKTVAEAMGVPFKCEWYGSPDKRNYRVSFDKIQRMLKFKPDFNPSDGTREIQIALNNGDADGDDPRTITVQWYKKLLSDSSLARHVSLNGAIL